MLRSKLALIACFVSASVLALASRAHGRTWTVLADGSGEAPTIQWAIDYGAPGDSAMLGEGLFLEAIIVQKPFSIIGAKTGEGTTVSADGARIGFHTDQVAVVPLLLESLTLVGAAPDGYGYAGHAVVGGGTLVMKGCTVTNDPTYMAAVSWSGHARIEDCEFRDLGGWFDPIITSSGPSMLVQRCTFRQLHGPAILAGADLTEVLDSRFEYIVGGPGVVTPYYGTTRVSRCLFIDIDGSAIGPWRPPVHSSRPRSSLPQEVIVESNTFVRASAALEQDQYSPPLTRFAQNVVTGGSFGVDSNNVLSMDVFSCNNVWANDTNWYPVNPTGQNGNISESPHYCDAVFLDYHLGADSPCLPENNACGLLMGAFGQGCGPTSVKPSSWGSIKAMYR